MTLSQTKVQGPEGGGWIWEASDYLFSKTQWLRGWEREVGAEDGLRVLCPSAMLDGEGNAVQGGGRVVGAKTVSLA